MGAVIRLPGTLAQSQIALSNEAMNVSTKIFDWFYRPQHHCRFLVRLRRPGDLYPLLA
jgi:hypothetical protein